MTKTRTQGIHLKPRVKNVVWEKRPIRAHLPTPTTNSRSSQSTLPRLPPQSRKTTSCSERHTLFSSKNTPQPTTRCNQPLRTTTKSGAAYSFYQPTQTTRNHQEGLGSSPQKEHDAEIPHHEQKSQLSADSKGERTCTRSTRDTRQPPYLSSMCTDGKDQRTAR